ncbi:Zinc carboxypeptidase A 1, partial [Pseudolycoriella hygida]
TTAASIPKQRFDNFKIFSVNVENSEQLNVLSELEKHDYDFWESPVLGDVADLVIPPDKESYFMRLVNLHEMNASVKVANIQDLMDLQQPIIAPKSGYEWELYHSLDEIYAFLDELLEQFPTFLTPFTVGYSYENREIRGVKLSRQEGNKAILIDATIHAREWISTPAATWLLKELLKSEKPEVADMSSNIDWYIIPVNRAWRKSRTPHSHLCYGVDLNRNFDFHWNTVGASDDPCSDIYAGPSPFSDKESIAYKDFFEANKERFMVHFAFHSPGQYILSPFGYTYNYPDNHDELMKIGNAAAKAISQRNGTEYLVGTTAEVLRPNSGTVRDWMKGVHNISATYTIEMRYVRQ